VSKAFSLYMAVRDCTVSCEASKLPIWFRISDNCLVQGTCEMVPRTPSWRRPSGSQVADSERPIRPAVNSSRLGQTETSVINSPGQPAGICRCLAAVPSMRIVQPHKISLRAGLRCKSDRAESQLGWGPGLKTSSVSNAGLREMAAPCSIYRLTRASRISARVDLPFLRNSCQQK